MYGGGDGCGGGDGVVLVTGVEGNLPLYRFNTIELVIYQMFNVEFDTCGI